MAKSSISSSYPSTPSSSSSSTHKLGPSTSSSSAHPPSYKILSTLIFPNAPQKHHTVGRGTPGNGITPWMNSGDLRILGGRRGKLDQVDPESLTSFC
ncbi:hypothetical protein BOTCAL_0326g00010 [Botryotinia calthae]|uniref:Uncharacterized protein n=1 Tax=Botryotinia calthae TaxID=38488 RepID=A0A4Y8CTG3_9HELO|nr:hypothetical protein BOTCAL_0326g00010 [Botryotinia calthae]